MGVSASCNLVSLSTNPHLVRLSSTEAISLQDAFWEELLDFSFPSPDNSADSRLLEESVDEICNNFCKNNSASGNMSTLLSIVISLIKHSLTDTTEDNINKEELETLYNSLLIVRTLTKKTTLSLSLEESAVQFVTPDIVAMAQPSGTEEEQGSATALQGRVVRYETSVDELCFYLFEFLINFPVKLSTIQVHSECVKILTTLMSGQLYSSSPSSSPHITTLMTGRCSTLSPLLTQILLTNAIHSPLPHPTSVSSYLWSYVPFSAAAKPPYSDSDFFTECLLLLFLLTSHSTASNPYKRALNTFGHKEPGSNVADTCFVMDLDRLYCYFCREEATEQDTLLLYSLLQGNVNVKAFLLSRTDIERMLLPLLRVVYDAESHSTHHMYMILIILLILTHDDHFSSYIHDLILPNVPWYKERVLSNVSVGGVLILVILKTIQTNMTKMRDKYLHTNCLATLANMSSKFHSFHPYVAEKILNLFTTIVKKYGKIRTTLLAVENGEGEGSTPENTIEYWECERETLEDIIRMFLEILNSSICYSGKNNPVFIYELLHKREVFLPFQTHPAFSELIINIESILGYLNSKLEERTEDQGISVSVDNVMVVIEEVARQWPVDRLQKTPLLKFEYLEESRPEEFFLPYIWTLLFSNSNMYWDTTRISLKL